MDWIVGVLLLVVGAIIGFFAAKFLLEKKITAQAADRNDASVQDLLKQHAVDHVNQSREILQAMQARCEDFSQHLESYESILQASQQEGDEKLSFLGEHATLFIQHQQAKQKRKRENPEFQPRDFSNERTGLFTDAKNKQVVDNK